MDRLTVETVEVDAFGADTNGTDQLFDAGVLRVRNGDATTDAGATEFFTLQNGLDDTFGAIFHDIARGHETGSQFADNGFLILRLQFRLDCLHTDKIGKLH